MSDLLCEDFYLLSINRENGEHLHSYVYGGIVLAGLFDLHRSNDIQIEEEKIYLLRNVDYPHSFLQKLMNHLNLMPNGYKMQDYIQNILFDKRELKKQLENELLMKGTMEKKQKKLLSFFTYEYIKIVKIERIERLKEQIRHRVLNNEQEDSYLDSLILLISICKMEELIFSIGELQLAKEKIKMILKEQNRLKSIPIQTIDSPTILTYIDAGCDTGDGGGCD